MLKQLRLLHLSLKELGGRGRTWVPRASQGHRVTPQLSSGVEVLSAAKGPVTLVTEAVLDVRGAAGGEITGGPPKIVVSMVSVLQLFINIVQISEPHFFPKL